MPPITRTAPGAAVLDFPLSPASLALFSFQFLNISSTEIFVFAPGFFWGGGGFLGVFLGFLVFFLPSLPSSFTFFFFPPVGITRLMTCCVCRHHEHSVLHTPHYMLCDIVNGRFSFPLPCYFSFLHPPGRQKVQKEAPHKASKQTLLSLTDDRGGSTGEGRALLLQGRSP